LPRQIDNQELELEQQAEPDSATGRTWVKPTIVALRVNATRGGLINVDTETDFLFNDRCDFRVDPDCGFSGS
jgi:hypothetical protein